MFLKQECMWNEEKIDQEFLEVEVNLTKKE